METKERYCQSCGMPMTEESLFGTNADNSKNSEYCTYCYQKGSFTDNYTMEEMIDFCLSYEKKSGAVRDWDTVKSDMMKYYPTLKRWKKD